ncbi:hypothetical protein IAU59_006317 [Kwoniella sp. CBS 9459]
MSRSLSTAGLLLAITLFALIQPCSAWPQQQSAQSQAQGPSQPQADSPSSSSSLSSSTSTAPSASSTSNGQRQYVNIPTSTIVSIGVGFVAFSSAVVIALLIMRVLRIRKVAIARGVRFKVVWRSEGGFWGFWTSFAGSDAEMVGVGGGGYGGTGWGMRVMRERMREAEAEKMRPVMWESEWHTQSDEIAKSNEHGEANEQICAMDDSQFKPLAIRSSTPPPLPAQSSASKAVSAATLPTIDLCVLIRLPSLTPYDPAGEELPELVIGRTTLSPMITAAASDQLENPATHGPRSPMRTTQAQAEMAIGSRLGTGAGAEALTEKQEEKGEIQQIEYAGGEDTRAQPDAVGVGAVPRRAEWKMVKGHWVIEGI